MSLNKIERRERIKMRIRKIVSGTPSQPRMTVYRSKMCIRDRKEASIRMEKLLKSAIANWEAKNESERLEDVKLCVKEVFVDGGRMLKRIQAAPQGRAHRIRKRSNHVTIVVDKMVTVENK